MTTKAQKNKHAYHLLLCEQLFIILAVTPELSCKLHLAVYGLRQILGQDVLTSLTETQQWQQMRYEWLLTPALSRDYEWTLSLVHINHLRTLNDSHWVQFFHLHQLAAQTPDFLLQLWSLSMRGTPEWASLLELVLCLCLLQLSLQLIHLPPHKNNVLMGLQLWLVPL